MKFAVAIDEYVADMQSQGRFTSPATVRDYRYVLSCHLEDVDNRDPRKTGREDVKTTLRRWSHPNSQGKNRAILVSFYTWMVEEGHRETNPAQQTRRARRIPSSRYRLSRNEIHQLLGSVRDEYERRAIYLGICAGLRNAELRGLQGRHFARPGFIQVTSDISKGRRERLIPVNSEIAPLVARSAAQCWSLTTSSCRPKDGATRERTCRSGTTASAPCPQTHFGPSSRASVFAQEFPPRSRPT